MERKRAWITSVTIGVTFIAATGAVMANTGLLSIGPVNRKVGLLTAADLAPTTAETTPPATSPTTNAATQLAEPIVVVKYEDVYVTAPPAALPVADAAVPVTRKKVRLPKASTRSTLRANQTISVQAKVKSEGSTDDSYNDEKEQHGDEGDD
jgi:hypothetical protein